MAATGKSMMTGMNVKMRLQNKESKYARLRCSFTSLLTSRRTAGKAPVFSLGADVRGGTDSRC